MTDPPLRVALIGAGRMGQNHLRVCGRIPDLRITSLVDSAPEAVQLAENMQLRHKCDVRELDLADVDCAIIATPSITHHAIADYLLKNNVPTLVEKPVTTELELCKELRELVNETEVFLGIGHVERFNPSVLHLRQLLEAPFFSAIWTVRFTRHGPMPVRILDVGVVLDLMSHDIDLLQWLFGREVSIEHFTLETSGDAGREEYANLQMRGQNGTLYFLSSSWWHAKKQREIEITGPEGQVTVNLSTGEVAIHSSSADQNTWASVANQVGEWGVSKVSTTVGSIEPLEGQLLAFAKAVRRRGKTDLARIDDGLWTLQILNQILNHS